MKLANIEPKAVFKHFEEMTKIPHGSGNTGKISEFCVDFAIRNSLKYIRDEANNVVIYKDGTHGMEEEEPIILQAHTDMVCQKREDISIDFEKDGLDIYVEDDFIKAKGTTLGADNGIGVSIIMAILESKSLAHPPIEAVFTTDEEIGMIGAGKLDKKVLRSKRMINIDSEEEDTLTVSCAGGLDCEIIMPTDTIKAVGEKVTLCIQNLKGGHSGVEIDKNRVNANILMGRILNHLSKSVEFEILSINGGDKVNAIPKNSTAELVLKDIKALEEEIIPYFEIIKEEIYARESEVSLTVEKDGYGEFTAFLGDSTEKIINMLATTPNGIIDMSAEIEGLVETSLNLGILKTDENFVLLKYGIRSSKRSALKFMQEKMETFASLNGCKSFFSGEYNPWEYKKDSYLQTLYKKVYEEKFGKSPKVAAIHAGLECAVFASEIDGLDAISIGPDMFDIHTFNERLSISSTKVIYEIVCKILEEKVN